jgi:hypothetical protein
MFIAPAGNRLFVGRHGVFTPASKGGTVYTSGVVDVVDLTNLSHVYTFATPASIWSDASPRDAAYGRATSPRDVAASESYLFVLTPRHLLTYRNAPDRFTDNN